MKTNYTRTSDEFVKSRETIKFTNKHGEAIQIDLYKTKAYKQKNSIMHLWVKNKFLPKFIENYITVNTYATTANGDCFGWYNPANKISDDKKRLVLNFDWVLEDTEENRQAIIDEVVRLANADEWTDKCRNATK